MKGTGVNGKWGDGGDGVGCEPGEEEEGEPAIVSKINEKSVT